MKNNDPHFQRLFDSAAQAEARERCIEAYRRLSVTVDEKLAPADADLAQLAIGSMLEKLGVILPPAHSKLVH